jgi:hypothetical protein
MKLLNKYAYILFEVIQVRNEPKRPRAELSVTTVNPLQHGGVNPRVHLNFLAVLPCSAAREIWQTAQVPLHPPFRHDKLRAYLEDYHSRCCVGKALSTLLTLFKMQPSMFFVPQTCESKEFQQRCVVVVDAIHSS